MEYSERSQKNILGIDTSNYKTSLAVVNQDDIICDIRKFLKVKEGERGLRQSEALFQHVKNLPELFEELRNEFDGDIDAVAFSNRPRPVEGSYMPCFLAGESFGRSLASMLGVPAFGFSHQEGHIEAIKVFTEMSYIDEFLACHFSGGTCEILRVRPGREAIYDIELIGGSKDISFGQVLDRAGVSMGFSFPCGERMDRIAVASQERTDLLTPIKVAECELNLSGIDTQVKNILDDGGAPNGLVREIFEKISDAILRMLLQASEKTGLHDVIMSGGVSTSRFIREAISDDLEENGVIVYFDDLDLSSDNAVGTALLGGHYIWE